jgi:hypothetical protein
VGSVLLNPIASAGGLSHQLHVILPFDKSGNSVAEQRMIVNDKNANGL